MLVVRRKGTVGENVPCDRGRILIVDDEGPILRLFRMILSSAVPDREIDLASNGLEAVGAFQNKHHAVVLMDLHMPVMDGQAAFVKIRKLCHARKWEMPCVVFCTGFASPETVRRLIVEDPAHCPLAKPVKWETLVEAVKSRLA